MDKKELLQRLRAANEINTISQSKNWKDAFKAYREATGENLSMGCNRCYAKVKTWLEA
jgi:hypothetical protein